MSANAERKKRGMAYFINVVKLCLAIAVARGLFSAYYGNGMAFANALLIAAIIAPILGGVAYVIGYSMGSGTSANGQASDQMPPLSSAVEAVASDESGLSVPAAAPSHQDVGGRQLSNTPEPMSGDMKGILWVVGLSVVSICCILLYQAFSKGQSGNQYQNTDSSYGPPILPPLTTPPAPIATSPEASANNLQLPSLAPPSLGPNLKFNGASAPTPETGATEDPLKPRDISGTLPTSVAAGQSAPVVTVNGGVEYGCGGTTGTACFLLVGDGASYVISMLHDTSDAMTEKLNSAIQSQSCIEVTGRLSPDKMGVFFAFSPGQQVGINECSQEQALADQPVNSDWFEIGRTTDVTMNLKTSTFRRTGQGTADSAACILGQMLTSKGSLLNQYCVYERDCVAGYGTIYIQEVDFRPSSSASFGVGAKGSASVTAEFLCNAINVTKR